MRILNHRHHFCVSCTFPQWPQSAIILPSSSITTPILDGILIRSVRFHPTPPCSYLILTQVSLSRDRRILLLSSLSRCLRCSRVDYASLKKRVWDQKAGDFSAVIGRCRAKRVLRRWRHPDRIMTTMALSVIYKSTRGQVVVYNGSLLSMTQRTSMCANAVIFLTSSEIYI